MNNQLTVKELEDTFSETLRLIFNIGIDAYINGKYNLDECAKIISNTYEKVTEEYVKAGG